MDNKDYFGYMRAEQLRRENQVKTILKFKNNDKTTTRNTKQNRSDYNPI